MKLLRYVKTDRNDAVRLRVIVSVYMQETKRIHRNRYNIQTERSRRQGIALLTTVVPTN